MSKMNKEEKAYALARLWEMAYRSGDVTEAIDYFGNAILEEMGVDLSDVKKVWKDLQA